jgi:hypothetical protein
MIKRPQMRRSCNVIPCIPNEEEEMTNQPHQQGCEVVDLLSSQQDREIEREGRPRGKKTSPQDRISVDVICESERCQ